MKFNWELKTRIIPKSHGTKGKDWSRFYQVQQNKFFVWFKVKDFDTEEEAQDWVLNTTKLYINYLREILK